MTQNFYFFLQKNIKSKKIGVNRSLIPPLVPEL